MVTQNTLRTCEEQQIFFENYIIYVITINLNKYQDKFFIYSIRAHLFLSYYDTYIQIYNLVLYKSWINPLGQVCMHSLSGLILLYCIYYMYIIFAYICKISRLLMHSSDTEVYAAGWSSNLQWDDWM